MKIVVTGGSGFIGRFVVKQLRIEGHKVVSFDILSINNGIKVDLTDKHQVKTALEQVKPEIVIHLAAMAGAKGKGGGIESLKDPYKYLWVNICGTLNIFETCRELKIEHILCMSSFAPFGIAKCPITETSPFQPNNPYGTSKVCIEEVAKCYSAAYGIKTVIFRVPLICGEGQKEMNVLREFVTSSLQNAPIVILGEGKHVREFIHPHDITKAYSAGISYILKMNKPYDVFVLGNKPVAMKELAELVIRKVGKGSIEFRSANNKVFDQFTDYSKVTRILRWMPTLDINEIVDRVIDDVKK